MPPPARMVVRESIYHEVMNTSASRPKIYEPPPRSYQLTTDEEPWQTDFEVGSEWTSIPCGWIEKASLMLLWNEELDQFKRKPTKDEIIAARARIVVIKVGDMLFSEMRPGDPATRIRPWMSCLPKLCCPSGKAKVRVMLFPE